jgi:Zn-dependent protease
VVALLFFKKGTDFVVAITIGLVLHELAHGAMMRLYGQKFNLLFVPLLGGATIPTDVEKFSALSDFKQALIYLAGPITNFILIIVGAAMNNIDSLSWLSYQMVLMNAFLVLINITPLGPTDGSKIASIILRGTKNHWIKAGLASFFGLVCFSSLYLFFGSDGSIGIWPLIGILVFTLLAISSKVVTEKKIIPIMTAWQTSLAFGSYVVLSSINLFAIYVYVSGNFIHIK